MIVVRATRLPDDSEGIAGVDTSFSSDRIYRVTADGLGFRLVEEEVSPPIVKAYPVLLLAGGGSVFVAEEGGEIVGFAEVELASWNRRATITHLYITPAHRGRGVGTALVEALDAWARSAGARCLWLETQNVNVPAVRFYRRVGFRLCGLDDTLYDPASDPGEVALFFVREVDGS